MTDVAPGFYRHPEETVEEGGVWYRSEAGKWFYTYISPEYTWINALSNDDDVLRGNLVAV